MSQDSSGNETQPEASRAVSDAWRDMPSAASSTDGNDLAIRPGGEDPALRGVQLRSLPASNDDPRDPKRDRANAS